MKLMYCFLILLICSYDEEAWSQTPELQTADPSSQNFSVQRLSRIDSLLNRDIAAWYICGATALIIRHHKVVYNKAMGWTDITKKTSLRTDNIFRIASQTKAITSVAVMMLFEEGKLLLDDPISKYIPSFAEPRVLDTFNEKDSSYTTVPAQKEITIRNLLTHTSGIDYPQIGSDKMKAIYAKAKIPPVFVNDKLLLANEMNKLAKMPLAHQPGAQLTYGLSLDVLAYLVEIISGKNLADFFSERIFRPLGMKDSYFYLPKEKFPRLVGVCTEDKNGHLKAWDSTTFDGVSADYPTSAGTYYSGSAGLVSTTRDYAVFLQMLLNKGEYEGKRLLAKRTVELMTTNQIDSINLGVNKFGLGFELTTKAGQSKLGVSEGSFSWAGFFGTYYWVDPSKDLIGLLYMQQDPITQDEIPDKFMVLVYQALTD